VSSPKDEFVDLVEISYSREGSENLPLISYITSRLLRSFNNSRPIFTKQNILPFSSLPFITFSDGTKLYGDVSIARFLARLRPQLLLYGDDLFTATEVDQWIDSASNEVTSSTLVSLNTHLTLRTFLVGFNLSLADIVLFVHLTGKKSELTQSEYAHLQRWFTYLTNLTEFNTSNVSFV